jgi:hypothetical protein
MGLVRATFAVLAIFFGLGAAVHGEDRTIVGRLVDQICFLKDPATANPSHDECGQICAKRGSPVAVLTDDGRMYVVAGDLIKEQGLKLRPFLGRRIQVTGWILEQRDGRIYDADSGQPVRSRGRMLHDPNGLIVEAATIAPAAQR